MSFLSKSNSQGKIAINKLRSWIKKSLQVQENFCFGNPVGLKALFNTYFYWPGLKRLICQHRIFTIHVSLLVHRCEINGSAMHQLPQENIKEIFVPRFIVFRHKQGEAGLKSL